MGRLLALVLAVGAGAGPVLAQTPAPLRQPEGVRIYSPGQFGVTAETPSRMERSREQMNRGRNARTPPPATADARALAETVVARAGLICTVVEAAVIGRARDGGPLVEVDCAQGGGVIIADGDPMQIVDCLDLAPDSGQAGRRQRVVTACRLPGNAGLAAGGQSARN